MADATSGFFERLRTAGVDPGDSDETRLNKSLLMLATGLVSVASMLWLALYWSLGLNVSSTLAMVFQLLLVANVGIFLKSGNFELFRLSQLTLFLLVPFVAQWSIGNFVSASGIVLWGLLAPIGAVLFFGVRESISWFVAYVFLLALSGGFDYFLADLIAVENRHIPLRTTVIFFALNFITISAVVYLLLRFSIREKHNAQGRLIEAHQMLQKERDRSEHLLLNILPGAVAERLKHGAQTIADGFADVAVMFADIVNFTQVAEGLSPNQVFAMLNRIFSRFDELAEQHNIERIKTIGDAYMGAGGLDQDVDGFGDDGGDYCAALAEMALAMIHVLENDSDVNSRRLEIRIGICTGPVVAGVVGKKKFIYDLWGDTVNIASRITSESSPGMIQVDGTTWRRLRDRYDFGEPQSVVVKGKGRLTIYRLLGRKADGAEATKQSAGKIESRASSLES